VNRSTSGDHDPKPKKPAKKRARKAAASRGTKGKGEGKKAGGRPDSSKKGTPGRPTKRAPEVERRILEGLSKGTPLTILCEPDDMPSDDSVRNWMDSDPAFSRAIARAREAGFDRIALDALEIADNVGSEHKDTIETKFGEIPNKEWILRSKLRVETRLKLLAKWDPKRYGEKLTQEISGPDGGPIQTDGEFRPSPEDEEVIRRIREARERLQQPPAEEGA